MGNPELFAKRSALGRGGTGSASMGGWDDFNVCCIYFCTGLSVFGVVALIFMGVVLGNGGNWYLGVPDDGAAAAASACFVAAAIYGFYVLCCGFLMTKLGKKV